MRIFCYDYDTEKIILPESSEDLPPTDLLWGQIYDESDPPTIILDTANYDPSLSRDYLAETIGNQLGIPLLADDILIAKPKTGSFRGDTALYNGEIFPLPEMPLRIGHIGWNLFDLGDIEPRVVDLTEKIERKRQKRANILDPIHETLDQDVFNGIEPDLPFFLHHIHKIKRIVGENGYNPADFEFFLTGSLCTYQYHDTYDVDISIMVVNEQFSDEERSHLISIIVNELDGEPFRHTLHEYQHYLQPNGIDIYDLFSVGMRAGYDFQAQKWVQKPSRMKAVDINKAHPDWIAEAVQVSDKINSLLEEGYDEEAQTVYEDLHRRRKEDQLIMGDESPGNVIYKFLDSNGTFMKLREIGQYIA
jgi:hypothetical protein